MVVVTLIVKEIEAPIENLRRTIEDGQLRKETMTRSPREKGRYGEREKERWSKITGGRQEKKLVDVDVYSIFRKPCSDALGLRLH